MTGIKAVMEAMPKALETMKKPEVSTQALSKLLNDGGVEMQVRTCLLTRSGRRWCLAFPGALGPHTYTYIYD